MMSNSDFTVKTINYFMNIITSLLDVILKFL